MILSCADDVLEAVEDGFDLGEAVGQISWFLSVGKPEENVLLQLFLFVQLIPDTDNECPEIILINAVHVSGYRPPVHIVCFPDFPSGEILL